MKNRIVRERKAVFRMKVVSRDTEISEDKKLKYLQYNCLK